MAERWRVQGTHRPCAEWVTGDGPSMVAVRDGKIADDRAYQSPDLVEQPRRFASGGRSDGQ